MYFALNILFDFFFNATYFSSRPITTMTTPLTKTMSAMNPPTLSLKIKKNKTELTGDVYIGETLTLEMSNVQGKTALLFDHNSL